MGIKFSKTTLRGQWLHMIQPIDEANAAYKRYERFMDQANSVNDKLSKNIMKVVDQR